MAEKSPLKDPIRFRAELMVRNKRFRASVAKIRSDMEMPEEFFASNGKYQLWAAELYATTESIDEKLRYKVIELCRDLQITTNYREFIRDFILFGKSRHDNYFGSRVITYMGNGLIQAMPKSSEHVFIEIFPETSKRDIEKLFKKDIPRLKKKAFTHVKKRYTTPDNPEIVLRIYELTENGDTAEEAREAIHKEYPDFHISSYLEIYRIRKIANKFLFSSLKDH